MYLSTICIDTADGVQHHAMHACMQRAVSAYHAAMDARGQLGAESFSGLGWDRQPGFLDAWAAVRTIYTGTATRRRRGRPGGGGQPGPEVPFPVDEVPPFEAVDPLPWGGKRGSGDGSRQSRSSRSRGCVATQPRRFRWPHRRCDAMRVWKTINFDMAASVHTGALSAPCSDNTHALIYIKHIYTTP